MAADGVRQPGRPSRLVQVDDREVVGLVPGGGVFEARKASVPVAAPAGCIDQPGRSARGLALAGVLSTASSTRQAIELPAGSMPGAGVGVLLGEGQFDPEAGAFARGAVQPIGRPSTRPAGG